MLELVDDAPVPEPGEGEVLVKVSRAGVNFADTHARENSYLAKYELPLMPGAEVAGVTRGTGSASSAWRRTAATPSTPSSRPPPTFPMPDGVSDTQALALLIQGLTAWHLYKTSAQARRG